MEMTVIATARTDFASCFGIPRQSGLAEELEGEVIFEKPYRNPYAVRGLDGFTHIWLLWQFSEARRDTWSATVRPPRLGGNRRLGVFATRSPYRPNPIGLSCVRLKGIEYRRTQGPVLLIAGADLMDGTPIYDIKPYLPVSDCRPEACGSFADEQREDRLRVVFPEELLKRIPAEKRRALTAVLAADPRPAYQDDPNRVYGFPFAGWDVRFRVEGSVLNVCEVERLAL